MSSSETKCLLLVRKKQNKKKTDLLSSAIRKAMDRRALVAGLNSDYLYSRLDEISGLVVIGRCYGDRRSQQNIRNTTATILNFGVCLTDQFSRDPSRVFHGRSFGRTYTDRMPFLSTNQHSVRALNLKKRYVNSCGQNRLWCKTVHDAGKFTAARPRHTAN